MCFSKIFKKSRRKVTILTAAGFNMPPAYGSISTGDLTALVNANDPGPQSYEINGTPPGQYFHNVLTNYYSGLSGGGVVGTDLVNFETVIFLVEELYSYYTDLRQNLSPEYHGILPPILELVPSLDRDIRNAAITGSIGGAGGEPHNFLRHVMRILVDPIIQHVGVLDSDSSNVGMNDFRDQMLTDVLPDTEWVKRIYTLNYDTWINQNAGYWDGFDGNDFNTKKVFTDYSFNCHYNLHGCVRWRPALENAGIEKLSGLVNIMGYGTSDQEDQDRHPLIKTPIITGYNKAARLTSMPYLALHHAFLQDLINSDFVIVIGYGGADPHINNMLSQVTCQTLVVNYFSQWMDNGVPIPDPDIWDDDVRNYLERVIEPHGNGWAHEQRWGSDPFIKSNDDQVAVWWKGLCNELYQEMPTLL